MSVPTAAFVVRFQMTVAMGAGIWGLPELYVSYIAQEIIAPVCVCNGLQGIVTTSLAYTDNRPGIINFVVTFPAFVPALKYPSTCATNSVVDIDVTWMKDAAPTFVATLNTELQGDIRAEVVAYIRDTAMGTAPTTLTFTPPTYRV